MYVINDIELLQRLAKHRILDYILSNCSLAVSSIRVNDYSFNVRQTIETMPAIKVLHVDDAFETWFAGRRRYLSLSDLSSLYVALINNSTTLVLSEEDRFMISEAKNNRVAFIHFDDFIISIIKDERIIQLYNLIKVA